MKEKVQPGAISSNKYRWKISETRLLEKSIKVSMSFAIAICKYSHPELISLKLGTFLFEDENPM